MISINDYKIHYCKIHQNTIMYFKVIKIYENVIPEPCWDCMKEKNRRLKELV